KTGAPFARDILAAWQYGPVFPNLYVKTLLQRNYPLRTIAEGKASKLTPGHQQLITKIVNQYGPYTPRQLVNKTCREEPWKINFLDADWSCNLISDTDLYQFYAKQTTNQNKRSKK
ncbi:Panacea domain-containing protein, partial [Candidatus Phytoplasma gossypii]